MDSENNQTGLHDLLARVFHTYPGKRVDFAVGKLAAAIDRVPETLFRSVRNNRLTLELAQDLIRHSQHLVENHPGYRGSKALTFEDLKQFVVDPDCLD